MSRQLRIPLQRRRTDERALAIVSGEESLGASSPVALAVAAVERQLWWRRGRQTEAERSRMMNHATLLPAKRLTTLSEDG